ncbi:histidinol dehydrogenase [Cupriavidus pauculus]|uniref:histidinol dehydrogenase n=1 Tax=Cupriavidus pauculus TaxID=82633 RepID=UPI001EE25A0A|nr:histidinol dehydrogenase [Cupriavidus pauculus]GJG95023.1 histidinol dehydrogenase [Cupriavidus pauculus]
MEYRLKSPAVQTNAAEASSPQVRQVVEDALRDIRARGDAAVRDLSNRFDKWSPESFKLSREQIEAAIAHLPAQTLADIRTAQANVQRFAQLQRSSITDFESEVQPGVILGQKNIPINSVGAYIPGGRYPLLASAHMIITTAKVAGVKRVIACTPPNRGEIPYASVAAAHFAGADEIYLLGGVQAVGAMAIGTETMPRVDMLAGPGNAYVAEAKRQLFGEVGIDLFAGPTEVLIIADESANPFVVATDIISQAEHGPDSPAVLVTTSRTLGEAVLKEIDSQLSNLVTREVAEAAWRDFGEIIVTDTIEEAYAVSDRYGSEHVQVLTNNPRHALEHLTTYGALFMGENTCVSFGDKVIGTNHVLPTRNAARYTGGLWVGKFLKTVTYQEITSLAASGAMGELCARASRAENFEGHARSGDVRAARAKGEKPEWAIEQVA